jgi:two-component system, sensor histidine kinase and response regulator
MEKEIMATNAARKSASGYLDVSTTLERLAGDEELFGEIAQILVQTAPEQLLTISAALAAGDMKRGYEEAHSLKGAVGAFEAPEVFQAVAAVERYAKGDDAAAAKAAMAKAHPLVETLLAELRPYLPAG